MNGSFLIYYRDSFNSVIRSIGISVILSVLTGGHNDIVSEIINNLMTTSYSRDIEAMADDFALELLAFRELIPFLWPYFSRGWKNSIIQKMMKLRYYVTLVPIRLQKNELKKHRKPVSYINHIITVIKLR